MIKINLRRILLTALLIGALILTSRLVNFGEGLGQPPFTTFSTGHEGAALFFDSLRIMGFPVGRDTMFLSAERPVDNLQIIIAPQYFDADLIDGMIEWVIRGGTLMFFSRHERDTARLLSDIATDMAETLPGGVLYRVGLGRLFIGDAAGITNISLLETNGRHGQQMANILETLEFRRIYFNEAYHGFNHSMTFFEVLPLPLRLIGVQLGITALGAVLYLGRRFGKPSAYYDEVEREENEYVFTLSNLYMSIGLGSAVLEVYERKLKIMAADYFKTPFEVEYPQIYELWNKENKPSLGKLEYIIENHDTEPNTKRRKERREFLKMVACYKDLMKELKT